MQDCLLAMSLGKVGATLCRNGAAENINQLEGAKMEASSETMKAWMAKMMALNRASSEEL